MLVVFEYIKWRRKDFVLGAFKEIEDVMQNATLKKKKKYNIRNAWARSRNARAR